MSSSWWAAAAVLATLLSSANSVEFRITNNCAFTVWPAALNPAGGTELKTGEIWKLNVAAGQRAGRIWGRTQCDFSGGSLPACKSGDCGGTLQCGGSGATPATLVEYTLNGGGNNDFYDISLVDGFNLPVSVAPSSGSCRKAACSANIGASCPAVLQSPAGCMSACTAFPASDRFCCRGVFGAGPQACPPSVYSTYFKGQCPDAYSYAYDDQSSTFVCPSGSDYDVVFCP